MQALGETALSAKGLLELQELPAEQVAGLVDQADEGVGCDLGTGSAKTSRV
jgi:hypothetical protein